MAIMIRDFSSDESLLKFSKDPVVVEYFRRTSAAIYAEARRIKKLK